MTSAVRSRRRVDVRGRALTLTALATIALGALIAWWPQDLALPRLPSVTFDRVLNLRAPSGSERDAQLERRFAEGVMMLHMRQYDHAITAFHRVLELAPNLVEAHVNMGFALIGLERWSAARDFFETATELRHDQPNAYYGLAIALEAVGDLAGAKGAMRTYLHRAPPDDPFRPKAEAALWEWEESTAAPTADASTGTGPH